MGMPNNIVFTESGLPLTVMDPPAISKFKIVLTTKK